MDRLQIAFFGATNSGKSTLVTALAGQEVSLVSELPGTTTDPVRKVIELPELGPCVLVDTAGFGDPGALGAERERRSRAVIDSTDIAVLLRSGHPEDDHWVEMLQTAQIPVVELQSRAGKAPVEDVVPDLLRSRQAGRPGRKERLLTGGLVGKDDIGLVDKSTGDGHALLLTAGKLVGLVRGTFGKAHECQEFLCTLLCLAP